MKKYYDISVPISPDLPVWPGDPSVVVERISKLEDGAESNVTFLQMSAHTGTHVDAPYHFLKDGKKIDEIDPDILIGPVLVVEIPDPCDEINSEVLQKLDYPEGVQRILFKTSNSRYWDQSSVFQKDYCAITPEAAWLMVKKKIRLIGLDYLSVAPFTDTSSTHEILLRAGVVLLEGINLQEVEPGTYELICLPLRIKNADGAPARVFLSPLRK